MKCLQRLMVKKGVDLVQSETPDLIICDIMMPELDGYGVLHMLSKNPKTSSIPFYFSYGKKPTRTDFRKGMEMGADDYITKPFDDIELLNAVETRMKKKTIC
jgi:DNA-binding response OmpR family regulator